MGPSGNSVISAAVATNVSRMPPIAVVKIIILLMLTAPLFAPGRREGRTVYREALGAAGLGEAHDGTGDRRGHAGGKGIEAPIRAGFDQVALERR